MECFLSVVAAEDDADDAFILQRAFKANGLQRPVHIVHDGGDAIAYLHGDGAYADRALHPFPDLLILDLKMPLVSGFDVLEWINQNPDFRVIPALVWSASADRRDVKHAFCLGAHAYLCKPVGYERSVEMVRHIIAFWEHCERPGIDPMNPSCHTLQERKPFSGAHF